MPRIVQYPAADTLTGEEEFVIDQDSFTKSLTLDRIKSFVNSGGAYDIAMGMSGEVIADAVILVFNAVRAFTLPANLTDSVFSVQAAPSNAVTLTLYQNAGVIGSLTWASGETEPTVTFVLPADFTPGDELRVETPANVYGMETLALTFVGSL